MKNDTFWIRIIYVVSVVISLVVAFLILGPRPEGIEGSIDVSFLPMVNATLNGITTLLLIIGYYLILNKKREAHKSVMLPLLVHLHFFWSVMLFTIGLKVVQSYILVIMRPHITLYL